MRAAPAIAAALLFGCGGAAVRPPQSPALGPARFEVVACAGGAPVSWDALLEGLLEARAIYVGERHDEPFDHEVQRAVIEAVLARDPSLALGMEMFQHPYQAPIDAYLAGSLDEAGLLAGVEWRDRWNIDFALYRPILELARAARLPVIALNARREVTRTIAREGIDALSPELRAEIPELDASDADHRAMVEEALGGHDGGTDPARLERFYLAQLVWDESMAARAAAAMSGEHAPRRIVVLAGRMHVQAGLGMPRRAARRGLQPFRVVLPLDRTELSESGSLCDYAVVR